MNQILMTQNKNEKKEKIKKEKAYTGNSIDIAPIIKFFAIVIILYGVVLSGSGVYAMISDANEAANNKAPEVLSDRNGNVANLTIKSEKGIRTVSYAWNSSAFTVVDGKNKTSVTIPITIPSGENKLNISVVDSNGKLTKYVKNYIQAGDDITEPEITFEVVNDGIKIKVTDDTALDYIVYKYGDEEEVQVDADETNPTVIEKIISVSQGQTTLKVQAVDKAQNVATKEQEVKGATKPEVTVTPDPSDPSYLIINVTDEEGLRMVTFYINDQDYSTDPNSSLGTKTFEWRQKVEQGETKVIVHAYNVNEQTTEFIGVYNY